MIFEQWERDAWQWPPDQSICEWAEKTIVLPSGVSQAPGPLSLDVTPYLREPLESLRDRRVEEVVFCTSTQVGKSTFEMIALLSFLDRDPWNAMLVLPTQPSAIAVNLEVVQPVIKASPKLSSYLTGRKSEMLRDKIQLNGITMAFVGALSPTELARRPVRYIFLDEVDKFPEWSGKEADPIELAQERAKTFHDSKIVKVSTPTVASGYIVNELKTSTNERYHLPCPHCGKYQSLVFGGGGVGTAGIKWPKEALPDEIIEQRLAWYECAFCTDKIYDRHKPSMLSSGVWCPSSMSVVDGSLVGKKPSQRKRGFHLWAAYGPWPKSSFSHIAAQFLRSKDEERKLMNFRNSWLGEPWEIVFNKLDENHLVRCSDDRVSGDVPEEAFLLTAGVDVQSRSDVAYMYFAIRGWGAGGKSWLIRSGIAESWEALYQVLITSEYKNRSGVTVPMRMVLVDSGHKTDEVYSWCRHTNCIPTKGASGRPARHLRESKINVSTDDGVYLPLYVFDTVYFKNKLHRLIRGDDWHLTSDTETEYHKQMTAEQQISEIDKRTGKTRTVWRVVAEGRPNHYFDCEVLNIVASERMQIENITSDPMASQQTETSTTQIIERIF